MGNINLALVATGNWQLAAGGFQLKEVVFSEQKKNEYQLFTDIHASRQQLKASRESTTYWQ